MHDFIPYGRQYVDDDDIKAVVDVLKSDYLTQGPKVSEFENKICEYTGAKYCVAVSNGTAALHIAVKALDIRQGMKAITSPITFVASANCLLYNHMQPDFADIDAETYCISPQKIQRKISPSTRLIIPVHFAGHPCDMPEIREIAREHHCGIIEDAAHAIGSKYADGSRVGNCRYSDMTIFSFHPVKTLTSGEGGAITTNDPGLYDRLSLLRTHGITKEPSLFRQHDSDLVGPWYYEMQHLGFNYRITDLQCALGISQLKKIDHFIEKRREIVKKYNAAFEDIEAIIVPSEKQEYFSAFHLYVIQVKNVARIGLFNFLKDNNIGVNVHYIPVHLQPYYRDRLGFGTGDYPVSENYYNRAITLPLFPLMQEGDVDYVVHNVCAGINR